MPVDADTLIKTAGVIVGAVSAGKVIYDVNIGKPDRLRGNYKFTKEFFESLKNNPDMHPLEKERGYQAIAGSDKLRSEEIEYLINIKEPGRSLEDYTWGLKYLKFVPEGAGNHIQYKEKYTKKWRRNLSAGFYWLSYVAFALLAFSPIAFVDYIVKSLGIAGFFSMLAGTMVFFLSCAWQALSVTISIDRAERLITRQSETPPKIPQVQALAASE